MSNNTKTISVPVHMLDKVQQYMSNLNIEGGDGDGGGDGGGGGDCSISFSSYDDSYQHEVKSVVNARKTSVGWEYKIVFKGGDEEWVKDRDCQCELKIAKFRKNMVGEIRTLYLVCRVSTKSQTGVTHTSLDAQKLELEGAVEKHNITYDRICNIKICGSAFKNIPKELQKIGEAAQPKDAIWIWRVDRLSRNIVEYLVWLENLSKRNVDIFSLSENCSYKADKLRFIQLIVNAQREAITLGKRVKLSYKRRRERGDDHVGCLPFGKKYQKVLSDDKKTVIKQKLVDNTSENAIIQDIKDTANKETNDETASRLNQLKLYKRGKVWTASMIKRIRR